MWVYDKCEQKGDAWVLDGEICPDHEAKGISYDVQRAVDKLCEMMRGHYSQLCNVQLEHIDAVGYWFRFDVPQDTRRQTWCVYHSDLEEKV